MSRSHLLPFAIALAVAAPTPLAALGANNTLPASKTGRSQTTITPDALKPVTCAALSLTTLITGVNGTTNADLILGTATADTISGGNGNDCILAGAGNDAINCGPGTDIAIGGPGTDSFNANCETQIQ